MFLLALNSDTESQVWPSPAKIDKMNGGVADVYANRNAYYWLDCGRSSKADHAGARPRRHLDNDGPWSCWLLGRYILGAGSRLVCDRPVRWLCDVGLGRVVATFALSVYSGPASQSLNASGTAARRVRPGRKVIMCRGNFALRIVAVRPHSRCFSRLTPCKYVTVIQELEPSRFYRLSFHPFRDNLGPPCSGLGFVEYYVALWRGRFAS